MTLALLARLSQNNLTVYLLGGAPAAANSPAVADAAKQRMEAKFPGLRVVGTHHGFFNEKEEEAIIADIHEKKPDLLLVCTGMPRAEIWAMKHRSLPVGVTLCVGGTLDVMAGRVRLAPAFWRKIGLEWLYRLITQPWRARRMLDIPRFVWAVVRGVK